LLLTPMSSVPHIAIVLLAAGASTRLGRPKQLLSLNGITLLRRTAEMALHSTAESVHIVLGYKSDSMKAELKNLPVRIIENLRWQEGISTSLCTGLTSLSETIEAAVVVLCDQPKLSMIYLDKIIKTYIDTQAPIVASKYAGTVGVPALFNRKIFPELLSLKGDQGAKSVIERYSKTRVEIDFPGGEFDIDVDVDEKGLNLL
jgi:molybdenum cofactor cytidylyltransferase